MVVTVACACQACVCSFSFVSIRADAQSIITGARDGLIQDQLVRATGSIRTKPSIHLSHGPTLARVAKRHCWRDRENHMRRFHHVAMRIGSLCWLLVHQSPLLYLLSALAHFGHFHCQRRSQSALLCFNMFRLENRRRVRPWSTRTVGSIVDHQYSPGWDKELSHSPGLPRPWPVDLFLVDPPSSPSISRVRSWSDNFGVRRNWPRNRFDVFAETPFGWKLFGVQTLR